MRSFAGPRRRKRDCYRLAGREPRTARAVAKRNQALNRVQHWRWKTREVQRFALGGRRSGNRNLLQWAESDYVRHRFEWARVWMMRPGRSQWAASCFERAGLRSEVRNAADGVHRRIAHPLSVSFWRGRHFAVHQKIRAMMRNSNGKRSTTELADFSAPSLPPLSLRPGRIEFRRGRPPLPRHSALFPVLVA